MRRLTPTGSFGIALVCAIAALRLRDLDRALMLGASPFGGTEYPARNGGFVVLFAALAVLFAGLGIRGAIRARRR